MRNVFFFHSQERCVFLMQCRTRYLNFVLQETGRISERKLEINTTITSEFSLIQFILFEAQAVKLLSQCPII